MCYVADMATECVILPHRTENIFFDLVLKKTALFIVNNQTKGKLMKKLIVSIFIASFLGSGAFASGCNDLAALNTKIKNALKTASFNEMTLASLKNLQMDCKRQHDMGMAVKSIKSCNEALDLVSIN